MIWEYSEAVLLFRVCILPLLVLFLGCIRYLGTGGQGHLAVTKNGLDGLVVSSGL